MSVSGLGNKLTNDYKSTSVTPNQAKVIRNEGTSTDNVLDLSGDPSKIASEIMSQDISAIKAININGKLVSLNKEQIAQLVNELKEKCLNPDNTLKENFKFVNFEKSTGISVVESSLDASTISNINQTSLISNSLMSDIPKYSNLLSVGINYSKEITKPDLHKSEAKTLLSASDNFDKQITSINTQITSLQSQLQNNPNDTEIPKQISDLQGQAKLLTTTKEMLEINAKIHTAMASMGNGETLQTKPAQIANLTALNDKLKAKTDELSVVISEQGSNVNPKMLEASNNIVKKSCVLTQKVADLADFSSSSGLIASQKEYGSAVSLPGMAVQYEEFQRLARNGQHLSKGEKTEGDGKYIKGFKPDAIGFKLYSTAGVENSKIFADKFSDISQKIDNIDFSKLSPTQITQKKAELESSIRKMFQTTSGTNTISKDKIDKVVKIYMDEFDLSLSQSIADKTRTTSRQMSTQAKPNETATGEVLIKNAGASRLAQGTSSTEVKGFGRPAGTVLTDQNTENVANKNKVIAQTNETEGHINAVSSQQKKNETSEDQVNGLSELLDHTAAGSKIELHVGVGIRVGSKDNHIQGSFNFKAVAEKGFGNGPSYLLHLDWSAKIEGKLSLGDIFKAEFGAEYQKVLAGVGFSESEDVEKFVKAVQKMVTAKLSGTDAEYEETSDVVNKMVKDHSYESKTHSIGGGNNIQFGKSEMSKFGKSLEISTTDATYNIPGDPPKKQSVRDKIMTGELSLGKWKANVKVEKSTEYTDASFSNVKNISSKDPSILIPSVITRTSVELKVPGDVLLNVLKAGNLDKIPTEVLLGMIASVRAASGGLAELSNNDIIKKMNSVLGSAMTDAALIGKLAPLAAAADEIKKLKLLGKAVPLELEAEFNATIGIDFQQKEAGGSFKFGLSIGFEAKFDATVVIPTPASGVSITVNGGVEIKYATSYSK